MFPVTLTHAVLSGILLLSDFLWLANFPLPTCCLPPIILQSAE